MDGFTTRALAGAVCGVMTAAAGVGGTAMTVYGRIAQWLHRAFAAPQPLFAVLGVVAGSPVCVSGQPLPALAFWVRGAAVPVLPAGVLLGGRLSRSLPENLAVCLVFVVALAGALTTLFRAVGA